MPLIQKHITLGGKTKLLESCFTGWITHVWGLSVAFERLARMLPCPLSLCASNLMGSKIVLQTVHQSITYGFVSTP